MNIEISKLLGKLEDMNDLRTHVLIDIIRELQNDQNSLNSEIKQALKILSDLQGLKEQVKQLNDDFLRLNFGKFNDGCKEEFI